MTLLSAAAALAALYMALTLAFTYLVHRVPRKPLSEPPDWGTVTDRHIPSVDGGWLEVWRVEPAGPSRGVVLLIHGWGRNRDRMVPRARLFGALGYTTVLFSARDHGGSSGYRLMNAARFAEDAEAVMRWLGVPVILYGHSAGSVAAAIVAARNPGAARLLFLEACYARTREALFNLYCWFNPFIGRFFGPMILVWMDGFYRLRYGQGLDSVSPARLAADITIPVMLIHGETDRRFPLRFAYDLQAAFAEGQTELYIGPGAGHSDSSRTPGYLPAIRGFLERYPQADPQ